MRNAMLIAFLLSSGISAAEPPRAGEAWVAEADGGVISIFLGDGQTCQFDARSPEGQWLSAECAYRIAEHTLTIEFPRPLPSNGPKQLNLAYSEAADSLTLEAKSPKTFRRTTRDNAMATLQKR